MQKKYWLSILASFCGACVLALILSPLAKPNGDKMQVSPNANLGIEHTKEIIDKDALPEISFQEFESTESTIDTKEQETPEANVSETKDNANNAPVIENNSATIDSDGSIDAAPVQPSVVTSSNIFWCGDSVSYLSRGEIQAQFPNVTIDAKSGRTLAEGLPIFQAQAAAGWTPETVVIELGANTVADEDDFKQQYRDLLNLVPASATVYAVTIKTAGTYHNMHNGAIEDLKAEYPNLRLIDWYTYAAANESLLQDGCHPTYPEGVNAFVSFVKSSM